MTIPTDFTKLSDRDIATFVALKADLFGKEADGEIASAILQALENGGEILRHQGGFAIVKPPTLNTHMPILSYVFSTPKSHAAASLIERARKLAPDKPLALLCYGTKRRDQFIRRGFYEVDKGWQEGVHSMLAPAWDTVLVK